MRNILWFNAASLDGYHESADAGLDWHHVDDEFHEFAAAQLDEADTLLFGRKTYEMMAAFWPTPAARSVHAPTAQRMNRLPKVVVSATLAAADWGPVTVISGDMAGQLAKLKQQPGRDIILVGSSALAAGLLDAGLLDELRIMVMPVLLGSGHATAAGAGRKELSLAGVRNFRSGNVLLTYRPRH